MTKRITFTIISIFLSLMPTAQTKTDIDWVRENTLYFELNESGIQGEGAEILKRSINKSQFFILGEEHFSAKVSEFTNAIIPILANNGFKYFVAEIGPNSAEKITQLVKQKGSLCDFNTTIYQLAGDIPVPFFDGKEDEVFLKTAINNGFEIWGIDQEYMISIFLIDELYNLSHNKKQIQKSYKIAKNYLIDETKKNSINKKYNLFTQILNSEEVNGYFKNLDSTNVKTQKIISALKKSWEVYRLREVKDHYTSLHRRLDIMRLNFIDYYSGACEIDSLPKAMIKIGGNHASKGKSQDNIFDIGNFIMELANFNQKKSTTTLIYPSSYLYDDGSTENNIDKEDEPVFRPIIEEAKGKWILIDLKNIEKISWKNRIESESIKDYMYRFDYLIITPESKLTTPNFKK